jgi:putative membrane protein
MMLKKLVLMTCLSGALAFAACDKDDDNPPVVTEQFSPADSTFLSNAAFGNRAEIQIGQLAATQGTNDSLKAFGQMLVTAHQAAQASLDSIAGVQNITLPDTVNSAGKGMYDELVGLTGSAFDSTFIKNQMTAHTAAINMYQTYGSAANSFSTLKAYANQYLPTLQWNSDYLDSLNARLPQ